MSGPNLYKQFRFKFGNGNGVPEPPQANLVQWLTPDSIDVPLVANDGFSSSGEDSGVGGIGALPNERWPTVTGTTPVVENEKLRIEGISVNYSTAKMLLPSLDGFSIKCDFEQITPFPGGAGTQIIQFLLPSVNAWWQIAEEPSSGYVDKQWYFDGSLLRDITFQSSGTWEMRREAGSSTIEYYVDDALQAFTNSTGVALTDCILRCYNTGAKAYFDNIEVNDNANNDGTGNQVHIPTETWSDATVNGNDVTQATIADQPTYIPSMLNGYAGLRFDASDFMGKTGLNVNQGYTFHIVTKPASNGLLMSSGANGVGVAATTGYATAFAGSTITGTVDRRNTWNVWTFVANGASSEIRINDVQEVAGDIGAAGLVDQLIASATTQADIVETLLYDAVQSSGDITSAVSALQTKYAL